jgi:hypothetical protein
VWNKCSLQKVREREKEGTIVHCKGRGTREKTESDKQKWRERGMNDQTEDTMATTCATPPDVQASNLEYKVSGGSLACPPLPPTSKTRLTRA